MNCGRKDLNAMRTPKLLLSGLIAMSVILMLSGCSPTGWATHPVQDGSALNPGDHVAVTLNNGTLVNGAFTGMTTVPPAGYADYYTTTTSAPNDKLLPEIGQQVQLTTSLSETRVWTGIMVGFDSRSCWIIPEGAGVAEPVYFSSLTSLSGRNGEIFHRMELRSMYCDGAIPLMTALAIRSDSGTECVPLSSVRSLNIEPASGASAAHAIAMDGAGLRMQSLR
jgi:hypothetical protein